MSHDLSLKDYNLFIHELNNYRNNLKYQLYHYKDNLNMSEQLVIVDIIRKVNSEIIALKKNIPKSTKGFQINYDNKLKFQFEKLDEELDILSNKTRKNLTTEERDKIYKDIDRLIDTRTELQTLQQKHILGLGKNKRKRTTKRKRKRKQKKGVEESKKGVKKRKTKKKDKFILI